MKHRRVLSAAEESAWTQLNIIAQCLPTVMDQQLRRDSGLGNYEYAVLLSLYRAPERSARMVDLSTITSGSLSRLSHTITRLEERGLVTRERRGSNRHVELTEAGRRAFLAAAAGHMDEIRHQALDHVPPEKMAQLAELLTPIAEQLRAAVPKG